MLFRSTELSLQIYTNASDARLFFERGELHRLHSDWPAAKADFDTALVLKPDFFPVELARARLFVDSGQTNQALNAFGIYLNAATNDATARVERARVLSRLGNLDEALKDYAVAIAAAEPQPEYFIERAELFVRRGRVDEAIRGIDEGLRRLGNIVSLQTRACELELSTGNADAAVKRLETICAQSNRPELWLERKGNILREAGRTGEARDAYMASFQAIAKLPLRLQAADQMELLRGRLAANLRGMGVAVTNVNVAR